MFEQLGFDETTPQQVSILFGLLLGLSFGALAQISRFCFRQALIGDRRSEAAGIWASALLIAILGSQWASGAGLIDFADHRFGQNTIALPAILIGGLLFGAGMALARGCLARMAVLGAQGNFRAITVLLLAAIVAHASMKGVFAPMAQMFTAPRIDIGTWAHLGDWPGGAALWLAAFSVILVTLIFRARLGLGHIAMGAAIGALVPIGWIGTGFVLYDEFDPIPMAALSFIQPAADGLLWTLISTAIPANFSIALLGGVLAGAFVAALWRKELAWAGFEGPAHLARYASGAALMGFGGVLAGGCTLGAGLSGISTLSLAAILALGAIAIGAILTNMLLQKSGAITLPFGRGSASKPTTLRPQSAP